MNSKFYIKLTRILLALALGIGTGGSIVFFLLRGIIATMEFSDF